MTARMMVCVVGLAAAVLAGCAATAVAAPPGVRVWESPHDRSVTEGETTLDVVPDVAYAAAVDYLRWPGMFPDIVGVEIQHQRGADARVKFVRRDGSHDYVRFHNQPHTRTVWFESPGPRADVWAELVFAPGPQAGTTRVHSRLSTDVHGIASLFASGRVRSLRQQRVASDLYNLRTFFAATRVGSP